MTQEAAQETGGEPELLTVGEVAERFRVADETIHRWAREGYLPYVPLPTGLKRFRREVIDAIAKGEPAAASAGEH